MKNLLLLLISSTLLLLSCSKDDSVIIQKHEDTELLEKRANPNTIGPVLEVISPSDYSDVGQNVDIIISASDNRFVKKVEVYKNGNFYTWRDYKDRNLTDTIPYYMGVSNFEIIKFKVIDSDDNFREYYLHLYLTVCRC